MDNWYYKTDDRIVGPMTRQELDYLATIGRVGSATMIRCGNADAWRRMRPRKRSAVSDVPVTASEPVEIASPAEPARPKTETRQTSAVPGRGQSSDDVTVKKQAIAGGLLAVVLLLLFWFFHDSIPSMGLTGDTGGLDMATSDGSADTQATAASESSVGSMGMNPDVVAAKLAGAGAATGTAPVAPSMDSSGAAKNDQTTADASGGAEPNESGDLASIGTGSSANKVQPGDPLSKFTIAAPGEATFFGLSATGNDFVFVVDRSGSMQGTPLARAKAELLNCIRGMPEHVQVLVVFFDDGVLVDPAGSGRLTPQRLASLEQWVANVATGSGTNAKVGMQHALAQPQPPDAIFLLTDGEFSADTPRFIRSLNTGDSTIHTVALVSRGGEPLLKQIAEQNHGDYRFVP